MLNAIAKATALVAFLSTGVLFGQSRMVPKAAAEAAAHGDVRAVVEVLVRSGVSGGAVIPVAVVRGPKGPRTFNAAETESLERTVDELRTRRGDLAVQLEDGLVFAGTGNSKCLAPLRKELRDLRLQGPLYVVGHQLMLMANPSVTKAPPTLMNRIRTPQRASAEDIVSLFYQRLSVREALDNIVRQLPGAFWVFAEDQDPVTMDPKCTLSWWLSDGSTITTSYDLFPRRSGDLHR